MRINCDAADEMPIFRQPTTDNADMLFKEGLITGIDVVNRWRLSRRGVVGGLFDAVMIGVVNPGRTKPIAGNGGGHIERGVTDRPGPGKGGDQVAVGVVGEVRVGDGIDHTVDTGYRMGTNAELHNPRLI